MRVSRDSRGVWYARAYVGTAPDGRRIRPYRSFPEAETEEDAQAQADEWLRTLRADGTSVRSTVLSDLLEAYVSDRAARDIAPNTAKQWRMFARTYVDPRIGGRLAGDLNAYDLSTLEATLLLPKEQGGQGLSRSSVSNVHTFLSVAFDRWVELGICESNPMRPVAKPRPERHEAVAISEWDFATVDRELTRLIEERPADRAGMASLAYATAAWLSLHTGMRCGETCALLRRDVSRRLSCVRVTASVAEVPHEGPVRMDTKGRRSRNVSVTRDELDRISCIEEMQDAFMGRRGSMDLPLVTTDGSLMRPTSVSKAFSRIRDRCGLPKGCTFHSLRHTHATWLLLSGVDVKTVSERLGHASPATTLRVYAHVMPGRDQAAAETFERFAREVGDGE